ncbi:hypothetical protein S100141_05099 (plasmid) [Bacillus licheniformis]|nr:PAS domain-containing protein [Bacillus licheniformis]ARW46317.1 hypothetical protein S100141_05099 [Bacillus licheniformis]
MCQNPARYTEEGMSNESGYLRQIFDHLQDGIIMMDQERTILVINPSAEKMTGWKLGIRFRTVPTAKRENWKREKSVVICWPSGKFLIFSPRCPPMKGDSSTWR